MPTINFGCVLRTETSTQLKSHNSTLTLKEVSSFDENQSQNEKKVFFY